MMNNLVFEHEKIGGGESLVYTESREMARELEKGYGNHRANPYTGKLVGWEFIVPTRRVEFYHQRFLALNSQNAESKGVEIEQLTETTKTPRALRDRLKLKPMHDKGSVNSRGNLMKSGSVLPISSKRDKTNSALN